MTSAGNSRVFKKFVVGPTWFPETSSISLYAHHVMNFVCIYIVAFLTISRMWKIQKNFNETRRGAKIVTLVDDTVYVCNFALIFTHSSRHAHFFFFYYFYLNYFLFAFIYFFCFYAYSSRFVWDMHHVSWKKLDTSVCLTHKIYFA